jgi:hypothetical protein
VLLSGAVSLADDAWMGTWTLNVQKSKYSPGPAPKSMTIKFEKAGDATKFSADTVDAEGKTVHSEWTSKMDGKEVPCTGIPNADVCAPKKIDANSYTNDWKKDSKPTQTFHVVVSKDGKTLTAHQTGKNAKGDPVNTTAIFDKQ